MNKQCCVYHYNHKVQGTIKYSISTDLHEVSCKLAIAFPELVEGKVHAAVVDQVPGDGQRVSLGNTILLQALTKDYHDPLPVTARHLRGAGNTYTVRVKSKVSSFYLSPGETSGNTWT